MTRSVFVRPVRVSRATAIYGVHAYHTKVPPGAITPYVQHYTSRGDVVLDPFCGSGMTGLAAALAGRRAVLNDLSPAAVHIARNYTSPCDAVSLGAAAARLLAWARPQTEPLSPARHDEMVRELGWDSR
jgi:tRNA G26 N,N-dimethylase Trm1